MVKFSMRCLFSIYRRSLHCQYFITVRGKAVTLGILTGESIQDRALWVLSFLSNMARHIFWLINFKYRGWWVKTETNFFLQMFHNIKYKQIKCTMWHSLMRGKKLNWQCTVVEEEWNFSGDAITASPIMFYCIPWDDFCIMWDNISLSLTYL